MVALTWCLLLYFSASCYALNSPVSTNEGSAFSRHENNKAQWPPLDDGSTITRMKREKGVPKKAVRLSTGIYRFHLKTMPWTDAFRFCRSKDMELVAIESVEENLALAEYGNKTGFFGPFNGAWTSGCFESYQSDYVWFSTGQNVAYKNWATSHPSLPAENSENYCITFYPPDPQWKEAPISVFRPVICELPNYHYD